MLRLLSKIARRLGLVMVHITVVLYHHEEIRILQSNFPRYSHEVSCLFETVRADLIIEGSGYCLDGRIREPLRGYGVLGDTLYCL